MDEMELSGISIDIPRLVLAFRRLNNFEWDFYIGPKPKGFDDMPRKGRKTFWGKVILGKSDYTYPAMCAIERIVGSARLSKELWLARNGGTEREWLSAYISSEIRTHQEKSYK